MMMIETVKYKYSYTGMSEYQTVKTKKEPAAGRDDGGKVFAAVESFLDLGASKDLSFSGLNDAEKERALKMLAKLMKSGVVGYHYYKIDGRIEKHFAECEIGDQRLARAKAIRREYA